MAVYTDIPNDFSVNTKTKDLNLKQNVAAIKQSIMNLLTYEYEDKPFHPEMIFNLKHVLFEPLDNVTIDMIQTNLFNMLNRYEPRIDVQSVSVTPNYDGQSVAVSIIYQIRAIENQLFTINHYFYRTR